MEQGGEEGDRAVLVTLMQKRERQERDRGRNGMKNPHPALDLAGGVYDGQARSLVFTPLGCTRGVFY